MRRTQPTNAACRAAAQLGRTVSLALRDAELSPAGYRLLAYLTSGPSAAMVLAAKLAVSRPVVTVTTDWLEQRGYVTRSQDADDRRRVQIEITTRGSMALAAADELVAKRLLAVLGPTNEEERTAIVDALDRLFWLLSEERTQRHHSAVYDGEAGEWTSP